MKKLLIVGASQRSFVGRVLREQLFDEYEIISPGRNELDLLDGDAVASYLHAHPIDVIVHAAIHVPMWHGNDREAENDIRMFFNLERCRTDYGHLIHFGSGAEFDKRFPIVKVTEEDLGNSIPVTSYGFAKYVINQYTRLNPHITNLRLFGIFGPQENWKVKLITGLCYKAVMGLPLTVRQHCNFDFLYIDDLVPVVRAVIDGKLSQRDYNVCSGVSIDIYDIAKLVQMKSPKPVSLELLSDTWANEYSADNVRLNRELPNWCVTDMQYAIEKLLVHFDRVKDETDRDILIKIR